MSHAKVETSLRDHPKALAAGPAAMGVWLAGLLYIRDHLTDGFIPREVVPGLFGGGAHVGFRSVRSLVKVGLWVEVEGGYMLAKYAEKNQTKAEVIAAFDAARERMRRLRSSGVVRANKRRTNAEVPISTSISISSQDPEGVQGEAEEPSPETAEGRYAEAYAQGQRDVSKAPYPAPAEPWERGALARFTQTPGWGRGLRGQELLDAIRAWSRDYRQARDERAQYERGFPPKRCEEWARGAGWRYRPPKANAAPRSPAMPPAEFVDPDEAKPLVSPAQAIQDVANLFGPRRVG